VAMQREYCCMALLQCLFLCLSGPAWWPTRMGMGWVLIGYACIYTSIIMLPLKFYYYLYKHYNAAFCLRSYCVIPVSLGIL
jgi:hypothetical protein